MKKTVLNKGLYTIEKFGSQIMLYNAGSSTLYTFEKTGFDIIQGLRNNKSEKVIIEILCNKYNLDPSIAKKDYKIFVKKLINKKILVQKIARLTT